MINLFLEPFVFACPKYEQGFDKFIDFITRIMAYQDTLNEESIPAFISSRTIRVLSETDSFPIWNDVDECIKNFGIDYIQTMDVVRIVNNILKKIPFIEDRVGISEVLYDNLDIKPDNYSNERLTLLKEEYERLLVYMFICCTVEKKKSKEQILITSSLQERDISVKGTILECEFMDTEKNFTSPQSIDSIFPICSDIRNIHEYIEPVSEWQNSGGDTSKLSQALDIYIYKNYDMKNVEIRKWKFGSEFYSTLKDTGFLLSESKIKMLLRALSETVLNLKLSDTHSLRNGKSGSSPQVSRGKDFAWRRDIDYEYHLHYWETSDGPEFAKIVTHNDFTI